MDRKIRLSIHVIPASTGPANSLDVGADSSKKRQFLDFFPAASTVGQLFIHLDARCKQFYREQKDFSLYAIKNLQDKEGNDLPTDITLADIAGEESGSVVIKVLETHVNRFTSIPLTSALRPAALPPLRRFCGTSPGDDRPSKRQRLIDDVLAGPDTPIRSTELDEQIPADDAEEQAHSFTKKTTSPSARHRGSWEDRSQSLLASAELTRVALPKSNAGHDDLHDDINSVQTPVFSHSTATPQFLKPALPTSLRRANSFSILAPRPSSPRVSLPAASQPTPSSDRSKTANTNTDSLQAHPTSPLVGASCIGCYNSHQRCDRIGSLACKRCVKLVQECQNRTAPTASRRPLPAQRAIAKPQAPAITVPAVQASRSSVSPEILDMPLPVPEKPFEQTLDTPVESSPKPVEVADVQVPSSNSTPKSFVTTEAIMQTIIDKRKSRLENPDLTKDPLPYIVPESPKRPSTEFEGSSKSAAKSFGGRATKSSDLQLKRTNALLDFDGASTGIEKTSMTSGNFDPSNPTQSRGKMTGVSVIIPAIAWSSKSPTDDLITDKTHTPGRAASRSLPIASETDPLGESGDTPSRTNGITTKTSSKQFRGQIQKEKLELLTRRRQSQEYKEMEVRAVQHFRDQQAAKEAEDVAVETDKTSPYMTMPVAGVFSAQPSNDIDRSESSSSALSAKSSGKLKAVSRLAKKSMVQPRIPFPRPKGKEIATTTYVSEIPDDRNSSFEISSSPKRAVRSPNMEHSAVGGSRQGIQLITPAEEIESSDNKSTKNRAGKTSKPLKSNEYNVSSINEKPPSATPKASLDKDPGRDMPESPPSRTSAADSELVVNIEDMDSPSRQLLSGSPEPEIHGAQTPTQVQFTSVLAIEDNANEGSYDIHMPSSPPIQRLVGQPSKLAKDKSTKSKRLLSFGSESSDVHNERVPTSFDFDASSHLAKGKPIEDKNTSSNQVLTDHGEAIPSGGQARSTNSSNPSTSGGDDMQGTNSGGEQEIEKSPSLLPQAAVAQPGNHELDTTGDGFSKGTDSDDSSSDKESDVEDIASHAVEISSSPLPHAAVAQPENKELETTGQGPSSSSDADDSSSDEKENVKDIASHAAEAVVPPAPQSSEALDVRISSIDGEPQISKSAKSNREQGVKVNNVKVASQSAKSGTGRSALSTRKTPACPECRRKKRRCTHESTQLESAEATDLHKQESLPDSDRIGAISPVPFPERDTTMAELEKPSQASKPPSTSQPTNPDGRPDEPTDMPHVSELNHSDFWSASRVKGESGQSTPAAAGESDEVMEDQSDDDTNHSRTEIATHAEGVRVTSSASAVTAESASSSENDSSNSDSGKSGQGYAIGPMGSTTTNTVQPSLARLQRSAAPSRDLTTASHSDSDEPSAPSIEVRDEKPGRAASTAAETASQRQSLPTVYGNLYRWRDMPNGASQSKPVLKKPFLEKERLDEDSTSSETTSSSSDDDSDDTHRAPPSAQRPGSKIAPKTHRAMKYIKRVNKDPEAAMRKARMDGLMAGVTAFQRP